MPDMLVPMAKSRRTSKSDGTPAPAPLDERGTAAPPPSPDTGAKSDTVRVPSDIKDMLDTIAQHGLNQWNKAAAILNDPRCPLRAWLLPLYHQVIAEKTARAAQIKSNVEQPE